MEQIQIIDIVAFVIFLAVLIGSIIFRIIIKKRLKDIEGDSEVLYVDDYTDDDIDL